MAVTLIYAFTDFRVQRAPGIHICALLPTAQPSSTLHQSLPRNLWRFFIPLSIKEVARQPMCIPHSSLFDSHYSQCRKIEATSFQRKRLQRYGFRGRLAESRSSYTTLSSSVSLNSTQVWPISTDTSVCMCMRVSA